MVSKSKLNVTLSSTEMGMGASQYPENVDLDRSLSLPKFVSTQSNTVEESMQQSMPTALIYTGCGPNTCGFCGVLCRVFIDIGEL